MTICERCGDEFDARHWPACPRCADRDRRAAGAYLFGDDDHHLDGPLVERLDADASPYELAALTFGLDAQLARAVDLNRVEAQAVLDGLGVPHGDA